MSAHYDTYDYPSYWTNRKYEHKSEIIALKSFLLKINNIEKIVDIGAGFARLTPEYLIRSKKVILTDPSNKLLSIARKKYSKNKKIVFIQSKAENLKMRIKKGSCDLAIMIRVLHHINNPEEIFKIINRILKPGGYFILEFANKSHIKKLIKEAIKGNLTYLSDIFPTDLTSKKNKRKNTLPFINYHPDIIEKALKEAGFKVVEKRSVSNIRSTLLKRLFTTHHLLDLEEKLQKPLSYINFGPSIFLLLRKDY